MVRLRRLAAAFAAVFATGLVAAQVSPGPLSRAHADLDGNTQCMRCHASKREGQDARCLACHREIDASREAGRGYHARSREAACASCHPEHAGLEFALIEWPGGTPEAFDHEQTGWPLRGRHRATACHGCHQAKFRTGRAATLARRQDAAHSFVGLERECAACHTDAHRGGLGSDCTRCHGFEDWKKTPRFDHAATAMPLTGKHAAVACAKCHQPDASAAPRFRGLPHGECSACHADVHAGRLGPKCASCHTTAAFRDVARSAFDHERTRYPLRGAHRALACAKCHDPKSAWGPKPAFGTCASCHQDPHAGDATLAGAKVDCASCHSLDAFRPGVLAAERHAPRSFPLLGKHVAVACGRCHVRGPRARLGTAAVEIHPRHEACAACHADAHAGQLDGSPGGAACERCHTTAGWRPSSFTAEQHRATAWALDGAHAKQRCAACHGPNRTGLAALPAAAKLGTAAVALRGIERDCAGCHRDPHRFEPAKSCTSCHDSASFSPARFGVAEHARSTFPLEGAHRAVPCFACHAELRSKPSVSSLVHGPGTPRALTLRVRGKTCADCHEDAHAGQFARTGASPAKACETCHDAAAFGPASRFDHDRDSTFVLGSAHARVPCARCHELRAGPGGRPTRTFRGTAARCEHCHGPRQQDSGERP